MNAKFFVPLLLCLFSFFVNAQSTDSSYVPVKGNKLITVGLFSNSSFINYRVYKTDRTAIRLGADALYNKSYHENGSDLNSARSELTNVSQGINLSAGMQRSIFRLERMESYIGADIVAGYRSNSYTTVNYLYTTDMNGLSTFDRRVVQSNIRADFSVGVRPFVGVNLFVSKGISVGAEYRIPLFSTVFQTESRGKVEQYDASGNLIEVDHNNNIAKQKNTSATLLGSAMITVGFRIR